MNQPRLIVIDDEPDLAGFVCEVAGQTGYAVEQYHNAGLFIEQYDKRADVIVLDLMMPGMDGVEVIRFLAGIDCDTQLILISGFDSGVLHSAQKLATEQGLNFAGSLNKPFRYDDLHKLLSELSIMAKSAARQIAFEAPPVDELRDALKNNELLLHYQPKVGLNGYSVTAVEALVRWQHPVHGLLGPDLFIPVAEKHGLIDDLTWIVLEQAMAQCQSWGEQGLTVQIAVNMSSNTLKELDLPERMGDLVQRYGQEPSQLIFEVTETALMQELTKSLDILTRLRMRGFHLSIDDFGTGYSSLVQLHRAPFSEIKIDRSFVMDMDRDKESYAIIETVIVLGHKLGMKVVAEGVETQANLEQLAAMGCDLAQGYHIARPQPGVATTVWLVEYNTVG
ncbi:MAG TPA: EAL domain-containing protein [Gammaproteobacteria bacterium]|nr:EAL domain-containing protein [Gammaproteobacteria bacterium]